MVNEKSVPQSKVVAIDEKKAAPTGLTQREAVFIEVMRVAKDDKVQVGPKGDYKEVLNETHLKKIYDALVAGFKAGKISLKPTENNKKKLAEASELRAYVIGLVGNWLRRDPRLNGKGEPKTK